MISVYSPVRLRLYVALLAIVASAAPAAGQRSAPLSYRGVTAGVTVDDLAATGAVFEVDFTSCRSVGAAALQCERARFRPRGDSTDFRIPSLKLIGAGRVAAITVEVPTSDLSPSGHRRALTALWGPPSETAVRNDDETVGLAMGRQAKVGVWSTRRGPVTAMLQLPDGASVPAALVLTFQDHALMDAGMAAVRGGAR